MPKDDDQSEVIAFLASPSAYPDASGAVERHETHGAYVFLSGGDAYKIKRAVRFAYMDFSTLALRREAVRREVEINRTFAPEIYLGAVPVTREPDGSLRIGGTGVPVEWAVHMRRFAQRDVLSAVVGQGGLTPALAAELAQVIRDGHDRLPAVIRADGDAPVARAVDGVVRDLAALDGGSFGAQTDVFAARSRARLDRIRPLLRRRGEAGCIRRCHGDLHLNNIVLWKGRPTPFNALEFDEALATIDTLYDLAFLLMDLEHHRARTAANIVLNRYLWRNPPGIAVEGLAALPLFMGLRAAIRAMVAAQRAAQTPSEARAPKIAEARAALDEAVRFLTPASARLVAVGGFSGTGKSTLAAALAPGFDPAPGALHIRSDLERKAHFGADETERLPAEQYSVEANAAVYQRVTAKARLALEAGHAVVVDAVFSKPEERQEIEAVARDAGVPFDGLWLSAPEDTLRRRVAGRTGDASDATVEVVHHQVQRSHGLLTWTEIDAGGPAEITCRSALSALGGGGVR